MLPSSPRFASPFALAALAAFLSPGASAAQDTDVLSYAEIDSALEGTFLVGPGAEWSYFPGTEEPSVGTEWTGLDFDDSAWSRGPSPFLSSKAEGATHIPEMAAGLSTLYLRRIVEFPDLALYERIQLELPIDDGFVFYLNGDEKRRLHAGDSNVALAFDAEATSERSRDEPPLPQVDLAKELKAGTSVLALQALVHPSDTESFGIEPRVRVIYRITPAGERERLSALRARLGDMGEGTDAQLAYLEGRHLQRLGDVTGARAHFERAAELDGRGALPLKRLLECHRSLGTLTGFEAELRGLFGTPRDTPALRDTWTELSLEDLGRSPLDFAGLDQSGAAVQSQSFAYAAWVETQLRSGAPLRINCGGEVPVDTKGVNGPLLHADRFFNPSSSAIQSDAPDTGGYLSAVRVTERSLESLVPAYRIPLPPGAYDVRLAFGGSDGEPAEIGDAVFDVVVEGARVLTDYDVVRNAGRRGLDVRRVTVEITDGFLEVDLLPQSPRDAWICGLEVHPLAAGAFLARTEEAAARNPRAFEHAQLGAARRLTGDLHGALASFEAAEAMPGFLPSYRKQIAGLRDALFPDLISHATVDDLVARRLAEGEALLAAIHDHEGGNPNLATYFEGRLLQASGRFDEALGAFEALILDGGTQAMPYVRMAECLRAVGLGLEAAGFLNEALAGGLEPSPAFVDLWIGLNLAELERDPWEVIEDLRAMNVALSENGTLVNVPTSVESPQTWSISLREPTTTTWSRPSYDASGWDRGPGSLGSGHVVGGTARSLWNIETVFARRTFQLSSAALLYPHLLVNANDAGDVYLNGTRVANMGIPTGGYLTMPLRGSALPTPPGASGTGTPSSTGLVDGLNVLGIYGFNVRGASCFDVGLVQPIEELFWIADRLREDGAIRLNCGGERFVGPDKKVWHADRFYGWALSQSFIENKPWPEVHGTDNDALFADNRWFYSDAKSAWYQIPIPNGPYRVTLHFAEIEPKARSFDVLIEENVVLEDYDVATKLGFKTAEAHTFEIEVTDGWLDIRTFDEDDRSFISGIEIER